MEEEREEGREIERAKRGWERKDKIAFETLEHRNALLDYHGFTR